MRKRTSGEIIDALAERAQLGDQRARAELVARLDRLLWTVARRLNGVDHEDLWQEARLGLLRALDVWKPGAGASFRSYSVLWVRGRLSHLVRSAALRRRLELHLELRGETEDGDFDRDAAEPSDDGAAAARIAANVDANTLQRHLQGLKSAESYVIRHRMAGATLEEVGRGLGRSRERIRTLEARALERLRVRSRADQVMARG
jgi:RNA polymerase sigma factor (sigma-70 family)